MIGDGDEIQTVFAGMAGKMVKRKPSIGCERVGVQIALEPAAGFGSETQVDFHIHAVGRDHISSQHDLPGAGIERAGVVTGGGISGGDENDVTAGAAGTNLAAIWRDQPQIDAIDAFVGGELTVFGIGLFVPIFGVGVFNVDPFG